MSAGRSIHPWLTRPETDPAGQPELLEHLAACAICRARAAEHDPVTLFSLCALEPVPDEVAERVSRAAQAAIARAARTRRVGRALTWAALAASLTAAGLFGILNRDGVHTPQPGAVALVPAPEAPPNVASPAGMIEIRSPGSADVVEIHAGDLDFTMIYDKGLGI